MFCDKCGREIRHDSEYCSYCGVLVESTEVQTSGGASGNPAGSASEAHCVIPRAPKKHCHDCQKELPASSISDICALCTIRRRNRELEKTRAESDAAYAHLDRYDISDEFDQTVFSGNRYYKGNDDSEPLYRQRAGKPNISPFKRFEPAVNRGLKSLWMNWVVIACVIAVALIVGNIGDFSKGTPESDVSVTEAVNLSAGQSAWQQMPYSALPEDGSLPQTTDEGFIPADFYDIPMRVSEITVYELYKELVTEEITPLDISVANGEFSYLGGYLFSRGIVSYTNKGDTAETVSEFEMCTMMTRTQYIVVALSIDNEYKFDLRYAINPDGTITAQGAKDFSSEDNSINAGDYLFGNPPILPADFISK